MRPAAFRALVAAWNGCSMKEVDNYVSVLAKANETACKNVFSTDGAHRMDVGNPEGALVLDGFLERSAHKQRFQYNVLQQVLVVAGEKTINSQTHHGDHQ